MHEAQCSTATTSVPAPFSAALAITPDRPGGFRAELGREWTVVAGKLHGGLLLALVTNAALAGLDEHVAAGDGHAGFARPPEPLAVSAEFLRAPAPGPVRLTTEVVKVGRTVSVVRVALRQHDRLTLAATVTAGRLPTDAPVWADLPVLAPEPPTDAPGASDAPGPVSPLSTSCEVRLDPATLGYLRGERATPVIRGWVRPRGEPTNVLFAMLAGDVLPPALFNLGGAGWAPTVQLTVLVRARPEPGWLRLEAVSRLVGGGWFDEDATVIDSAGRLVCQSRQLALAPLR